MYSNANILKVIDLKFTKMHGIGNDYIYFDCTENVIENPEELSIRLSDRHKGVGGDGIVLIMKSDVADFRMRMFNADGSEGKMCGNATRCIGKFVYDKGLTDKTDVTLETLSGIKYLTLKTENGKVSEVTVDMGKVTFESKEIPIAAEGEFVKREITVDGKVYVGTGVSVGNPHFVVEVEDTDSFPLHTIGPKFENHLLFPERINTEFVKVIDENTLQMRVWERGSGETMACGTGACATAAAAVKNGICKADTPITVKLLGGDLKIVVGSDQKVFMTGPAEFVYEGELING